MKALKVLIGAALVALPVLLSGAPAEALTARQYMHQGHGVYTNSTGSLKRYPRASRWHRYHHHHRRSR